MKSMTGFGLGEFSTSDYRFSAEIKTVNHRYTDCSIRMTRRLNFIEDKVREYILKNISRGKIEVNIQFEDYTDKAKNVQFDESLADAYIKSLTQIKEKYSLNDEISIATIASFPDIIKVEKGDFDEESVWSILKSAIDTALDSLVKMREKEGEVLKSILLERICVLEDMLSTVKQKAPNVVGIYKNKLEARIKELLETKAIDEQRLATEVAYFSDRCNIDEEIDRLNSHFSHFRDILDSNLPIGRKLDFLVQEMNREVNTIGSKANDTDITNQVVEMKSEIEKIREQIQNVE